jgi:enoyl-CoA hydratase
MRDWSYYSVEVDGPVATVRFVDRTRLPASAATTEPHWEFAELLWDLAFDDRVRVVLLRGHKSGVFLTPTQAASQESAGPAGRDPNWLWRASAGVVRAHYAFALMDKPVIGCIEGDAINVGSSYLFAADIVIADETVRIADNHMGMGEVDPFPWRLGIVPGDGGVALVPLFLSPSLSKEYLLLSREFTAKELRELGAVAWAGPAAELNTVVDATVAQLLARPFDGLAWTKRLASKQVLDQLTGVLDAAMAYQMVNMLQFSADNQDPREL